MRMLSTLTCPRSTCERSVRARPEAEFLSIADFRSFASPPHARRSSRRVGPAPRDVQGMAACPAPERASMAQQAAPLPPPCPVAGQRGALLPLRRSPARAASSRTPAPPSRRSGTLTTRSCRTAGCRGWRCAGCPRRTTAAHQGLRSRTPLTGRLGPCGSTGRPAAACDGAVLTRASHAGPPCCTSLLRDV